MIKTLKHRGLKRLFDRGDRSLISTDQVRRIEDILGRLDTAETMAALDLPGYRLHALKGDLKRFWSITVSSNWRIVFRFTGGDVFDVNLIDYH